MPGVSERTMERKTGNTVRKKSGGMLCMKGNEAGETPRKAGKVGERIQGEKRKEDSFRKRERSLLRLGV